MAEELQKYKDILKTGKGGVRKTTVKRGRYPLVFFIFNKKINRTETE